MVRLIRSLTYRKDESLRCIRVRQVRKMHRKLN